MQLLGELLLDRANVKVMMRYVGDPANLKLMMILLKDSSRSIQFEAFHVFKAGAPLMLMLPEGIAEQAAHSRHLCCCVQRHTASMHPEYKSLCNTLGHG